MSEFDIQQLLGFETRVEVHTFLKEHRLHLDYAMDDLEHDMREADRVVAAANLREAADHAAG